MMPFGTNQGAPASRLGPLTLLLFFLCLQGSIVRTEASATGGGRGQVGSESDGDGFDVISYVRDRFNAIDNLPFFLDDDDEDETLASKVLPTISGSLTALYGAALIVGSREAPGQIHFITMMRATGFAKLEEALKEARRNFRQAVRSAVWRAPSFVMAARSIGQMQTRVESARKQMAMARQAREDGVITQREERELKRTQKRIIRNVQRDMKRLIKAGASIGTFLRVLDIDEIFDILKGFAFQFMAVLASGHNDSRIGKFVSRYCLTLNLGSLFLETNRRLGFPTSRLLLTGGLSKVAKEKTKSIQNLGRVLVYAFSGLLSFGKTGLARRVNAGCIGSSIFVRGIRAVATTLWDKKEDFEDSTCQQVVVALLSKPGGILLFTLSTIGFIMQDEHVDLPFWMKKPLMAMENLLKRVTVMVDGII